MYYTLLYHIIQYCIYTILYYTKLYYTILYYAILNFTILYYTILYSAIQYYAAVHWIELYYKILYATVLYCTILYCIVFRLMCNRRSYHVCRKSMIQVKLSDSIAIWCFYCIWYFCCYCSENIMFLKFRPLPLCQAKHFFPLVAGFAFILENLFWCSYEYWLNHNRDFPSQNKLQRKNPQVTI